MTTEYTTRIAQDAISTYGLDGTPTDLYPRWFGTDQRITDLVDRGILNAREADQVRELLASGQPSTEEPTMTTTTTDLPQGISNALVNLQVLQDETRRAFSAYLKGIDTPQASRLNQAHEQAQQQERQAFRRLQLAIAAEGGNALWDIVSKHPHRTRVRPTRPSVRRREGLARLEAATAAASLGTDIQVRAMPRWMAGLVTVTVDGAKRPDLVALHTVPFEGPKGQPWAATAYGIPNPKRTHDPEALRRAASGYLSLMAPEVRERITARAIADDIHLDEACRRDAVDNPPTTRCSVCQAPNYPARPESADADHNLCKARAERGLPTPPIGTWAHLAPTSTEEPTMKSYTVHTKAGVTYRVEARTETEAWSAGLDRIIAARDQALLPITKVTEDPMTTGDISAQAAYQADQLAAPHRKPVSQSDADLADAYLAREGRCQVCNALYGNSHEADCRFGPGIVALGSPTGNPRADTIIRELKRDVADGDMTPRRADWFRFEIQHLVRESEAAAIAALDPRQRFALAMQRLDAPNTWHLPWGENNTEALVRTVQDLADDLGLTVDLTNSPSGLWVAIRTAPSSPQEAPGAAEGPQVVSLGSAGGQRAYAMSYRGDNWRIYRKGRKWNLDLYNGSEYQSYADGYATKDDAVADAKAMSEAPEVYRR